MQSIPKPQSLSFQAVFAQNSIYVEEDLRVGKIENREDTNFWTNLVETILSLGVNLWCNGDVVGDLPQLIIRTIKPLSWSANLSKGITLHFHKELLLLWQALDIVSDLEEMQTDEIAATLARYPTSFYRQKSHWYTLPLFQCRTFYHFIETFLSSCYYRLSLDISLRLCREWTLLHLPAAERHLNSALVSEIKLQCETASICALSLAMRKSQSARAGVVLVRHIQSRKLKFLESCEFRPLKGRALQSMRRGSILRRLPILCCIYLALWPVRQIFRESLQLLSIARQRLLNWLDGQEAKPIVIATPDTPSAYSSPAEAIHKAICSDPTGVISSLARSTPPSQSAHSPSDIQKQNCKELVTPNKSSPLSSSSNFARHSNSGLTNSRTSAHTLSSSSANATSSSSAKATSHRSANASSASNSPHALFAECLSPERIASRKNRHEQHNRACRQLLEDFKNSAISNHNQFDMPSVSSCQQMP